jgi:hypothetical protein
MVGESQSTAASRQHEFSEVTYRCKYCGLSYLTVMGGGFIPCYTENQVSETKEPLTGDALWESIIDTARGS